MTIEHVCSGDKQATKITNLGDIQSALRLPLDAILRYFKTEIDLPNHEEEAKGEWIISGKHELDDLDDLLDK